MHGCTDRCTENIYSIFRDKLLLLGEQVLGVNLEKTVKQYKFTPPSPIKATPSKSASDSIIVSNQQIASDQDIARPVTLSKPAILCNSAIISDPATLSKPAILRDSATLSNPLTPSNPAIFSNPLTQSDADDVMLTSSSESNEIHIYHNTPTASNPPEGSTTAVVAVMQGNPKNGCTRQRSNKHCKQKMVWVLLDSGSNGDLIFVSKDKPMLLPYSKRLVPQSWNTLNEIF
jgi:hypothetical protein